MGGDGFRLVGTKLSSGAGDIVYIPDEASQSGDLMVILSAVYKENSYPTSTLTGYTLIKSATVGPFTDRYRVMAHYRICDGTEADISYGGLMKSTAFLFRDDAAITGVQSSPENDFTAQFTEGNPTLQTIDTSALTGPLLMVGATDGGTYTVNSPAFDTYVDNASNWYSGVTVKENGVSGVSMSWDNSDRGYVTSLISGFLVPQY
jgi:hypothetical protein